MSSEHDPTALENEMHLIAARLREKHNLDTVVVLACKQEDAGRSFLTESSFAMSGNYYAGKHLAAKYSQP
jgi:hypothetical protein